MGEGNSRIVCTVEHNLIVAKYYQFLHIAVLFCVSNLVFSLLACCLFAFSCLLEHESFRDYRMIAKDSRLRLLESHLQRDSHDNRLHRQSWTARRDLLQEEDSYCYHYYYYSGADLEWTRSHRTCRCGNQNRPCQFSPLLMRQRTC